MGFCSVKDSDCRVGWQSKQQTAQPATARLLLACCSSGAQGELCTPWQVERRGLVVARHESVIHVEILGFIPLASTTRA